MCSSKKPAVFSPYGRSFVVVIDATYGMAFIMGQLKQNLPTWLTTMVNSNPKYYKNFIIVPYYDDNTIPILGNVSVTNTVQGFTAALRSLSLHSGGSDCPNPTLHGVQAALQNIQPMSHVYVYSMATAKDPSLQNSILQQIASTGAQVGSYTAGLGEP